MLIDFDDIETEGRTAILEGLQRLTVLWDFQAALEEPEADGAEVDFTRLIDVEIKTAAGLFFGICRSIDVGRFPQTFTLCFSLLEILNAEFDRRRRVVNA